VKKNSNLAINIINENSEDEILAKMIIDKQGET